MSNDSLIDRPLEECRKEFEAWCVREGWDIAKEDLTEAYGRPCVNYVEFNTACAWRGWLARERQIHEAV